MNDNIQIESGVPIPQTKRGKAKYPFANMSIGESFFSEEENARTAALQYARNYSEKGIKFVTRSVSENGQNGFRIWRTE